MIRVDLGKDDVQRGKGKLGKLLALGKGGKKSAKLGRKLGSLSTGVRGTLLFAIAGALAFLPHLFFEQYKGFVNEQQVTRLKEIKDKLAVLEQETEKLVPYKRELESYEGQKKLVKDRIDVVRQLLASRNAPVSVLDAIGQALPKRAWLIKTELKIEPGKSEIILTGQAFANEDISDFVDSLQKSVFISEASLKNVTKSLIERLEVKQFVVSVTPKMKPMMQARPADVPGGAAAGLAPGAPGQAGDAGGAAKAPGRGTAGAGEGM